MIWEIFKQQTFLRKWGAKFDEQNEKTQTIEQVFKEI